MPDIGQRRRWPWIAAGVAAIAVAAVVVVAALARGDDGGGDDDGADITVELIGELPFGPLDENGTPPECPTDLSGWTSLPVTGAESTVGTDEEGHQFAMRADRAAALERDGEPWLVIVRLDLRNTSEPIPGTADDDIYYGLGMMEGLNVDGVSQGFPLCVSVDGDSEIEPGERAVGSMGFISTVDPRGVPIVFEAFEDYDIPVSDG